MPDSKYISLTLLLVIIVGFTGWWLLFEQQHSRKQIKLETPDSIAEDIHIINMDIEGKPSSQLQATKMMHYAYQNTSFATQPKLILFTKEGQPWHIDAAYAKAFEGGTSILLWKNVEFRQPGDKNNPETLILTDNFSFFPHQDTGKTASPITLLQPGVKVTATGLIANTATGSVELLHNVRGSYAAQD